MCMYRPVSVQVLVTIIVSYSWGGGGGAAACMTVCIMSNISQPISYKWLSYMLQYVILVMQEES